MEKSIVWSQIDTLSEYINNNLNNDNFLRQIHIINNDIFNNNGLIELIFCSDGGVQENGWQL
jgi:hypothetical protein